MTIKRMILALLACIVAFSPTIVHADSLPMVVNSQITDINDFKEYDSFMKRYHEHSVELTYFINASYNSNEHYAKENFQVFRDVINRIYDTDKNSFLSKYLDSSEELFSKPIALLGVSKDLRKAVWEKLKGFFKSDEIKEEFNLAPNNGVYTLPNGYYFELNNTGQDLGSNMWLSSSKMSSGFNCYWHTLNVGPYALSGVVQNGCNDYKQGTSLEQYQVLISTRPMSYNVAISFLNYFGYPQQFSVKKYGEDDIIDPFVSKPIVNNIINNFDTSKVNQDYKPEVKPMLVCPNEVVPLNYVNGTFKTSDNQVISIAVNETANYLNTICNLDFKFPEIYYHDDTGSLIVGGQPLTVPSTDAPADDYDYSIIEYIRNSYQYATNIVKSGVNGLNSIVNSTSGLLTLFANVFSFLPGELTSLMIGGLAISIGLWVFKR